MQSIERVLALEVLDSRGNPTILTRVKLNDGTIGQSIVPSGASTGSHEAVELRDKGERYGGQGVLQAINHINTEINNTIQGMDPYQQILIDNLLITLDGTVDKSRLGSNAILGVSIAVAKAAAAACKQPLYRYLGGALANCLPVPQINIINGGKHADNNLDIQEFMILPIGAGSFRECMRWSVEVYHALKKLLRDSGFVTSVGDEGGFAPSLRDEEEAINFIEDAIKLAGYIIGKDFYVGLDCASSTFFKDNQYCINGTIRNGFEMIQYYKKLLINHKIITIEDGLQEDDWENWRSMTHILGDKIQLVGDDLFVTNISYLNYGIEHKVGNAILIKPNQIGTISETMRAVDKAHKAGYRTIISHRSGDTEDDFIADLAVATRSGQIKSGSTCRTERIVKYNRLLQIESELGVSASYAGCDIFDRWLK